MTLNNVLVNDTVKIKVKFLDQDSDGNQVEANMASVTVTIVDVNETPIVNAASATSTSASEWYYPFVPTVAGAYSVRFTGITNGSPPKTITSQTNIYANNNSTDYRPSVTLRSDETILFAPDVSPLYLDPEELLPIFPEASLIEIGEVIYHHSLEIQEMYKLGADVDPLSLPFVVLEYIKAAAACDLSRTYGFGGDDELSLKLGDLEIVNRSAPRQIASRSNATTWCQIAASLRREVIAKKVSMRGVQPKGLPNRKITLTERDPGTGKRVYLISKDVHSIGRAYVSDETNDVDRRLRQYD
ncbi:hypothetical protein UFOVP784_112 [uncultured Caudovirales phage]|uniref:Uncharacterized protein n=1 Tax=uncultured Caudovirales phage TaxID=2100421 RepID=A0A6J5MAX3_9CAUD|nr:hypothetical protein UFOVP436_112 [uncultured Caudovirales phage]CAB4162770.1 hypothetical protein UFOVP784_112 [uncultured Caudovirales phage]